MSADLQIDGLVGNKDEGPIVHVNYYRQEGMIKN